MGLAPSTVSLATGWSHLRSITAPVLLKNICWLVESLRSESFVHATLVTVMRSPRPGAAGGG